MKMKRDFRGEIRGVLLDFRFAAAGSLRGLLPSLYLLLRVFESYLSLCQSLSVSIRCTLELSFARVAIQRPFI